MDNPLLHRVRLQHVRCLLATAQHGNMRSAAEALAISQPAVTKTIKELESIVGQKLVQRLHHGVVLTLAGEAFARHARLGMHALEQALSSAALADDAGLLRLGVLPSLATDWLQGLLLAWRAHEPQGTVRVATGRNAELLAQLQRGELDAVLGRLAEPDRMLDLRFDPLWAEPMVAAMHPQHALAQTPWSDWHDIDCPVVLPLPGTAIRQMAERFLQAHGCVLLQGQIDTLTVDLGRAWALDQGALWFTPESTVRHDAQQGTLLLRPLPDTVSEAVGLYLPAHTQTQALTGPRSDAFCALVHALAVSWRTPPSFP